MVASVQDPTTTSTLDMTSNTKYHFTLAHSSSNSEQLVLSFKVIGCQSCILYIHVYVPTYLPQGKVLGR